MPDTERQELLQPAELEPALRLLTQTLEQLDRILLGRSELHRMVLVAVLSRGHVVVDGGILRTAPGSGRFLARDAGAAAVPTGRRGPEFDPEQNFGAKI